MAFNEEQIVDERSVEFSLTSTSEKILEYKNIIPGNYSIRIVEDANKNGEFDKKDKIHYHFLNLKDNKVSEYFPL